MSRLDRLIKGVSWTTRTGQNLKFFWTFGSESHMWVIREKDTLRVLEVSINRGLDLSN